MANRTKLVNGYKAVALTMFNLSLVFVGVNLALAITFWIKDYLYNRLEPQNVIEQKYGFAPTGLYQGLTTADVEKLLNETWSRPYDYEPFTQFRESEFSGQFINVSPHGFRLSVHQGPWPVQHQFYNIFIFGGSTTFNYGLPDQQTIASCLQIQLNQLAKEREIRVYNFGRGYYYSSQECSLLISLIRAGHLPDMALFIDGLNEFVYINDFPRFTDNLSQAMNENLPALQRFVNILPLGRAIASLKRRGTSRFEQSIKAGQDNESAIVTHVIDRYMCNKAIIESVCGRCGIKPVFVWQPIPLYNYDLTNHLFAAGGFGAHELAGPGYRAMASKVTELQPGENFLWCADIQKNLAEPLYVDKCHYSAKMSELLATEITAKLLKSGAIRILQATPNTIGHTSTSGD